MSDSDYYLTGLLTCPQCGQRYIGTSARGRTRTYRYYTCFTRTRYGKHATCTAPRLPADEIDDLVLKALQDFYAQSDTVLATTIEQAHAQRDTGTADQQAELTAFANQITTTDAAIARYHAAFENGTMDDATAGPRIRELRQRLAQLTTRHADLEAQLDNQPTMPPPGTLARIRDDLTEIMRSGIPAARKAAIEALIAEVQLSDDGLIPIFKIPDANTMMPPPNPDEGIDDEPAVRTMVRSVGRGGLEP
jgi:site-specific DNA recombinase